MRLTSKMLLACALTMPATAARADILVLRSVGPSARTYPAAQRLPDSATFRLRAGDVLTILFRGQTRTFRGPGTYSATSPAMAQRVRTGQSRAATGAVRGPDGFGYPPSEWHLDVSMNGPFCYRTGRPITLWRPDGRLSDSLTVTTEGGSATFEWRATQQAAPLPPAVALRNASPLTVRLGRTNLPVRIEPRAVSLARENAEAVAQALLDNRCHAQLDTFIAQNGG